MSLVSLNNICTVEANDVSAISILPHGMNNLGPDMVVVLMNCGKEFAAETIHGKSIYETKAVIEKLVEEGRE